MMIGLMFSRCKCLSNKGIWFCHYTLPILYYYDFKMRKVVRIKVLPNEFLFGEEVVSSIAYSNEKIYIVPYKGNCIAIYDIIKDSFHKIFLKNANRNEGVFSNVFSYKNQVYCIPYRFRYMVIINAISNEIIYQDFFDITLKDTIPKAVQFKNYFIGILYSENKIIRFNMETKHLDKITIDPNMVGAYEIILLNNKERLFVFDDRKNVIYGIDLRTWEECCKLNLPFHSLNWINISDDNILIQDVLTNRIFVYDKDLNFLDEESEVFERQTFLRNAMFGGRLDGFVNSENDFFCIIPGFIGNIDKYYHVDMNSLDADIDLDSKLAIAERMSGKNSILVCENIFFQLANFLNCIIG